jgi:hypothetical protein
MAGMFFVNFVGGMTVIPTVFFHDHKHFSYADSIMPQFFFAVGIAFRMTFLRRFESDGASAAYRHAIKRNLTLFLLAVIWYGFDGHFHYWDTLRNAGPFALFSNYRYLHIWQTLGTIACTSLWVLPVIRASTSVRITYMMCSAIAYTIMSGVWYYQWVNAHHGTDGGPLSFMSWSVPLIVGTLAYDVLAAHGPAKAIRPFLIWGAVLMLIGYALSCINPIRQCLANPDLVTGILSWFAEPPFVPTDRPQDIWSMSQRSGTVSYLTFAAGFSLAILALFVWLCDLRHWEWSVFRTFGQNALAGYLVHDIIDDQVSPFAPYDAPLWYIASMILVYFFLIWIVMRYLERNKLYLKL